MDIECQQMAYAVDSHCRNKSRIMALLAGHTACDDQLSPLRVNSIVVRQTKHGRLNPREHSIRLAWRQAKSVVCHGTGQNRPGLKEIL